MKYDPKLDYSILGSDRIFNYVVHDNDVVVLQDKENGQVSIQDHSDVILASEMKKRHKQRTLEHELRLCLSRCDALYGEDKDYIVAKILCKFDLVLRNEPNEK